MKDYDYYRRKNVLKRRKRKRILILLTGAALAYGGIKYFKGDLRLPGNFKLPNISFTHNQETENPIVIYDTPEEEYDIEQDLIDEFENGEDEYEETNASVSTDPVESEISYRASSLYDVCENFLDDTDSYIYSEQDMENFINFMNGDYEVSNNTQAEEMYNKFINYCTILSSNVLNNDNTFDINLVDTVISNQNISAIPMLLYLDDLHRTILNTTDIRERDEAIQKFSKAITNMWYGGYEIDGRIVSIQAFTGKKNIASISLLMQYIQDILPYMNSSLNTNHIFINNKLGLDSEFGETWHETLIDANTDGQLSYHK